MPMAQSRSTSAWKCLRWKRCAHRAARRSNSRQTVCRDCASVYPRDHKERSLARNAAQTPANSRPCDSLPPAAKPKNALIKQYQALLDTEGIKLTFTDDAIQEIAAFATRVNESAENIGARRLHTILEKLLEEISFEGPDLKKKHIKIDAAYVRKQLAEIVKDQDLSRYIL